MKYIFVRHLIQFVEEIFFSIIERGLVVILGEAGLFLDSFFSVLGEALLWKEALVDLVCRGSLDCLFLLVVGSGV